LLLHEPPKEEHALIGPYSQTRLKETIASFPELKHPMHVYVLIHKQSKEVVRTHDLAQFSEERNLPKAQILALKAGVNKSAKGWFLVPKEYHSSPEEFLNRKLKNIDFHKKLFARKMFS
jgi:hypothetical protein